MRTCNVYRTQLRGSEKVGALAPGQTVEVLSRRVEGERILLEIWCGWVSELSTCGSIVAMELITLVPGLLAPAFKTTASCLCHACTR